MKKNKKASHTKKTEQFLQYKFTEKELQQKGKDLAEQSAQKERLALQKKEVSKDFDAKIAGCDSKIAQLSGHINTGSEHREVPCIIHYNLPEDGKKTVIRQDTMEEVEVKEMTDTEKQEELKFESEKDEE